MAKDSTHYDVDGPWTPMQIAFVAAYFEAEGCKTEAARLAGSKSTNPRQIGWELSNLEHVKKAIDKELPKRASAFAESAGFEFLQRLRRWLYADRSKAYDNNLDAISPDKWPEELRELLVGVSVQTTADGKIIRAPKFASLETLSGQFMRALNLLLARTDLSGTISATPAEVAKVRELRSATLDRIQGVLRDFEKERAAQAAANV